MLAGTAPTTRTSAAHLLAFASLLVPVVLAGPANFPTSNSRAVVLNSVQDFCLFGPQIPGQTIGDTEAIVVSYCLNDYGTRSIPAGAIQSAHFIETPHYYQIGGTGDLTQINILAGDSGGELDPHGATGEGNPVGSTVSINGQNAPEWHMFVSSSLFCLRACKPAADAYLWCQHIYDLQGCFWNDPGNYGPGFDQCLADSTVSPPGIYISNGQTSTYQQGDGSNPAPPAHAAGASSQCTAVASLGGGAAFIAPTQAAATTPAPAAQKPTTASPAAPATTPPSSSSTTTSSDPTTSSTSSSLTSLSSTAPNSTTASRSTSSLVQLTTRPSAIAAATSAAASTSPSPVSGATELVVAPFLAFVGLVAGLMV